MYQLRRISLFGLVLLLLAGCAQTPSGNSYINEVGANGLPTPRALFARHVEALGGEAVLRDHESTTLHGRFILGGFGIEGDLTMRVAAPNLSSQLIEIPGLGQINAGYNGEVAWSVDPMQGSRILQGDALTDLLQQSDYYLPMNHEKLFESEATVGQITIAGAPAYHVELTDARGQDTHIYFSAESNRIVRTAATVSTPMGAVNVITHTEEYALFDGQWVAVAMSISQAGQEFRIEVDEVSFNDVNDSHFSPPAEIQSQL